MAANVQIYPFLAKTSTSVHIAPISEKMLKAVPINRSSHDLHENRFASKKEFYLTATSKNRPGNKESSKTIKKPEKEWAQSIARRSYSQ